MLSVGDLNTESLSVQLAFLLPVEPLLVTLCTFDRLTADVVKERLGLIVEVAVLVDRLAQFDLRIVLVFRAGLLALLAAVR